MSPTTRPLRIAIADDEADMRQFLREVLSQDAELQGCILDKALDQSFGQSSIPAQAFQQRRLVEDVVVR